MRFRLLFIDRFEPSLARFFTTRHSSVDRGASCEANEERDTAGKHKISCALGPLNGADAVSAKAYTPQSLSVISNAG